MPVKVIGPYRVVDTLGRGGAGTVYRAVDPRTNDTVALKLLTAAPSLDPKAARRMAREFEALADLAHPNVVRVFDTGIHDGYPYLTMELIEGLTLRNYLSLAGSAVHTGSGSSGARRPSLWELDDEPDTEEGAAGPFGWAAFSEEAPSEAGTAPSGLHSPPHSPAQEVRVAARVASVTSALLSEQELEALNRPERVGRLKDALLQLCEALAYIHGKGLVHRDLKPSNIMVDEDRQVRLMDFGLAKFLADDDMLTAVGRHVGTYRYMAPEQILGEPLDGRADLYSLGVVLYELLAGRPPFDGDTPHVLWQQVLEMDPAPVTQLNRRTDPQLARVAHKLLRKEPEQRYQTAEEVYEALVE